MENLEKSFAIEYVYPIINCKFNHEKKGFYFLLNPYEIMNLFLQVPNNLNDFSHYYRKKLKSMKI